MVWSAKINITPPVPNTIIIINNKIFNIFIVCVCTAHFIIRPQLNDTKVNPKARINACTALLDRGWGKPSQYCESHTSLEIQKPQMNKIDVEERIRLLTKKSEDSFMN